MVEDASNPWLKIPAEEYEDHLSDPGVGQSRFLEKMFCKAMALLGCAAGNGLDHIHPERTEKITAVDINSRYLGILDKRFASKIKVEHETITLKSKKSFYVAAYKKFRGMD